MAKVIPLRCVYSCRGTLHRCAASTAGNDSSDTQTMAKGPKAVAVRHDTTEQVGESVETSLVQEPDEHEDLFNTQASMARNDKKSKKGTFDALELLKPVYAGIKRTGYNMPTPVQRKSLPVALAGRDVVCMARTGSGKTAAFLIPILQRLRAHSTRVGARALILSPTRELAMQTLKFAKALSHFMDLHVALLVGGESIDMQFEALHRNPDIIVGTPGRVMHHLQEVPGFSLASVQMVVFDEADRLFEMGFAGQIKEIFATIPEERQTLLYSATLPKALAQFARAGLRDPVLIRLDLESKISEQLCLVFFTVRCGDKLAALLFLLREVLPQDKLTIIFVATKHHVEYISEVMRQEGFPCSAIYGTMDFETRKLNLERFRHGKVKYLVVTDVAARGIDVPLLEHVINYSFPPLPKLFVHRVGRAARQGRAGAAFNLVDTEENAYMVDLHLFLGRPLSDGNQSVPYTLEAMTPDDVHFGIFPQHLLDEGNGNLRRLSEQNGGALAAMSRVCQNAMKQYRRTRPDPSKSAIRRAKELKYDYTHPLLLGSSPERVAGGSLTEMRERGDLVKLLSGFRPPQTILEVNRSGGGGVGRGTSQSREKATGPKAELEKGRQVMRDIKREHASILQHARSCQRSGGVQVADTAGQESGSVNLQGGQEFEKENDEVPVSGVHLTDKARAKQGRTSEQDMPKARLSRAARKQMKRSRHQNATIPADHDITIQCQPLGSTLGDYRDPQHFISYGVTEQDAMVEARLQPQAGQKSSETAMSNRLEEALLDVQPDEALQMVQRRRLMHWDARKRKYVHSTLQELGEGRGSKKVRTESGVTVSERTLPRGELYRQWQKRSNRSMALAGEDEEPAPGEAEAEGSAQFKIPRRSIGGLQPDDNRFSGFRKLKHTQKDAGSQKGGRALPRQELKSAHHIQKERLRKDREKSRLASRKRDVRSLGKGRKAKSRMGNGRK